MMELPLIKKTAQIRQMTLPTPFLVGPVNTYLIWSDALVLIDTGPKTEEAQGQLLRRLREMNLRPKDIDRVILTHHHPDHIGMTHVFQEHADIIGHPKMEPWLRKDMSFFEERRTFFAGFYRQHGMPENWIQEIEQGNRYYMKYTEENRFDGSLQEGDEIDGVPGWRIIETPGHAETHISLWNERDGTMIAGDHLIGHISSNAILEAPYEKNKPRPKTLLKYRDAMKKCRGAAIVYPGHGEDITEPDRLIDERLHEQTSKAAVFKKWLEEKEKTAFEVCQQMYPKMYSKQPALTFSETLGHFDLLEELGEITSREENGRIWYKSV
ncbi:MBL fold metallo-hydrolase [Salisediminibacterium halotolerans]|uniref:Glyoxylase, beta-lactamase superfamily II n=1 Tax=Salisediminibacterium halotolerans TaxID=517425 RepID=A0A1H9UG74_9BACI|nr:MBL fold metallo-hydrolase [Salisediminibacterium haloalkalitolerans]SES08359.1 Glyoxylase, beta-lactamase superfamily II [Salisediminibacterium haloalkalitolerans]